MPTSTASTVSPPTSPKRSPGRLHLRAPLQKLARRVSHMDFHRHRKEEDEEEGQAQAQHPEHRRASSAPYIEPVAAAPVAVAPSLPVSGAEGRRSLGSDSSSSAGEDKLGAPVPALLREEEEDDAKLRPTLHELELSEEASTQTIPDGGSSRCDPQPLEEYDEEGERGEERDEELAVEEPAIEDETSKEAENLGVEVPSEVEQDTKAEDKEAVRDDAEDTEPAEAAAEDRAGETARIEEPAAETDKSSVGPSEDVIDEQQEQARGPEPSARSAEPDTVPNTAALISSAWPTPPQDGSQLQETTGEEPHYEAEVPGESLALVEEEALHAPEVDLEADTREEPEDTPVTPPETELPGPTADMEAKTPSPIPDAPIVEPEVPDPFIVDDPEEPADEPEQAAPAADDVPLFEAMPPVDVNKDVPQAPSSSESDQDEEEAPDLYLPELVLPTMFLPIPNADPLTTLLNKYIYPPDKRPARDLSGDWHKADFHTLVMTNSWRALARMARDRLVAADPEDLTLVLGLWYLRLSALARLRLFNQTAAECTNLFAVLDAADPPAARAWLFERLLPFELEVLRARLRYWAGDPAGYADALAGLLAKCRARARQAARAGDAAGMWRERGARLALILASQLVEAKDYGAAARLLGPLAASAELRSAVGRIYLQAGDVGGAERLFAAVAAEVGAGEAGEGPLAAQVATNEAMLAAAKGEWARADAVLRGLLEREQDNYAATNNLAVALLAQGKLKDAIAVLEKALHAAPAAIAVAEPFLFNLSTLYELRSASAVNNKRELLITVARYSGDGLRTTCLKMPTS